MSENKMAKTPWSVDEDGDIGNEDFVLYRPYEADTEEMHIANAAAIVSAINNTYGAGVNPEAVPDMLNALVTAIELSDKELKKTYTRRSKECQHTYDLCVAAVESAKLPTL